jgi:hypothetical protein
LLHFSCDLSFNFIVRSRGTVILFAQSFSSLPTHQRSSLTCPHRDPSCRPPHPRASRAGGLRPHLPLHVARGAAQEGAADTPHRAFSDELVRHAVSVIQLRGRGSLREQNGRRLVAGLSLPSASSSPRTSVSLLASPTSLALSLSCLLPILFHSRFLPLPRLVAALSLLAVFHALPALLAIPSFLSSLIRPIHNPVTHHSLSAILLQPNQFQAPSLSPVPLPSHTPASPIPSRPLPLTPPASQRSWSPS